MGSVIMSDAFSFAHLLLSSKNIAVNAAIAVKAISVFLFPITHNLQNSGGF